MQIMCDVLCAFLEHARATQTIFVKNSSVMISPNKQGGCGMETRCALMERSRVYFCLLICFVKEILMIKNKKKQFQV